MEHQGEALVILGVIVLAIVGFGAADPMTDFSNWLTLAGMVCYTFVGLIAVWLGLFLHKIK